LVEKPRVGQCKKASQGSAAEEILGDEGKHLSRFILNTAATSALHQTLGFGFFKAFDHS